MTIQRARLLFIVFIVAILGVAGGFMLASEAGNAKENPANPVIAVVNGEEIRRSDVQDFVSNLPQQFAQAPVEQIYPMVIDQIINGTLVFQKAEKAKLSDDPEVAKRLTDAKKQIMRSVYIERQLEKRVTDTKMREEYTSLQKETQGKKETRARHILLETEDEAKAVIKELNAGTDFAELAKKKSVGPTAPNGGDLGYFTEDAMVPEFSKAAFALKPGTYTKEPVKTQFGWHVIKVEDRRDIQIPPYEAIKAQLQAQLNQEALDNILEDLRAEAKIERFTLDGQPLN